MAERAIRNRTITLSTSEEQYYTSRLLTLTQQTDVENVRDSTIHQDIFECLPLLKGQSIDLLFIDPPYNLTKSFNGRVFKQRRVHILIAQRQETTCHLRFHHISQYPNVIHGIFTRQGGYSLPPYRGLNTLGSLRGGDDIDTVIQNRKLALHSLELDEYPCITLWNVHGADVYTPDIENNWRGDWANRSYYDRAWTPEEIHKGDALITNQRGVALALSFADCVPIVFHDPVQQVIGIAHGGWRGTARGVVLATVDAMRERFGSQPRDILAGIGPAIGPCCYEVSEQVRDLFLGRQQFDTMPAQEQYRDAVRESATFSTQQLLDRESLRLDLWETNRKQLLFAGLTPEHIEVSGVCTSCHVDHFFSHRTEHGKTGRFPVIIALS